MESSGGSSGIGNSLPATFVPGPRGCGLADAIRLPGVCRLQVNGVGQVLARPTHPAVHSPSHGQSAAASRASRWGPECGASLVLVSGRVADNFPQGLLCHVMQQCRSWQACPLSQQHQELWLLAQLLLHSQLGQWLRAG